MNGITANSRGMIEKEKEIFKKLVKERERKQ